MTEQWRDPPGWSAAIERVAALSFGAPMTVQQIGEHFMRIAEIVCQELPESDERGRILTRIAQLEQQALAEIGALAVTLH
jgi:hypothetical protein